MLMYYMNVYSRQMMMMMMLLVVVRGATRGVPVFVLLQRPHYSSLLAWWQVP